MVNDYVDSADALCIFLAACAFEAEASYRGLSAIEIARDWAPSIVFLDIAMPDMSGLDIAAELKTRGVAPGSVLIAYTANVSARDVADIRAAGFDAFCAKPADATHLLALAQYFVEGRA